MSNVGLISILAPAENFTSLWWKRALTGPEPFPSDGVEPRFDPPGGHVTLPFGHVTPLFGHVTPLKIPIQPQSRQPILVDISMTRLLLHYYTISKPRMIVIFPKNFCVVLTKITTKITTTSHYNHHKTSDPAALPLFKNQAFYLDIATILMNHFKIQGKNCITTICEK